jgi:hypothetical protein
MRSKIDPTVAQWFHECYLGTELQAEHAKQLGVPNDLESIAKAYAAERKARIRTVKLNKGFGKLKK